MKKSDIKPMFEHLHRTYIDNCHLLAEYSFEKHIVPWLKENNYSFYSGSLHYSVYDCKGESVHPILFPSEVSSVLDIDVPGTNGMHISDLVRSWKDGAFAGE